MFRHKEQTKKPTNNVPPPPPPRAANVPPPAPPAAPPAAAPPPPPPADSSNEFDSHSPDPASVSNLASDSDIDTSAQEQNNEKQKKERKRAKKTLITVAVGVYAALCFLFFVASLIIFIYVRTSNMKYFVRPPNEVGFYTVVPDAYWDHFSFLGGIFIHLLIAIFVLLLLLGCKKTGKLLSRHHEKLMLWITILASIGLILMFAGSVNYLSSYEMVENGEFEDTVRPPPIDGCFHKNGSSKENLETEYDASIHIRINLKWLTQVSCGYHTHGSKTSDKPMWKSFLERSYSTSTDECQLKMEELVDNAETDCRTGNLLYITFHVWLVIDVIGFFFVLLLFYIYMKAVVVDTSTKVFGRRNHHERLSFLQAEDAKEAEQVKILTDKIKQYVVQELHSPAASKMASAMHLHHPNNKNKNQHNHEESKEKGDH